MIGFSTEKYSILVCVREVESCFLFIVHRAIYILHNTFVQIVYTHFSDGIWLCND